MAMLFRFFFLLLIQIVVALPHCKKYEDNVGKWVNTTECVRNPEYCRRHFLTNSFEANLFSQVWLPHDCAYFRFTNNTLFSAVEKLSNLHPSSVEENGGRLRLIFMGDSALRGIFCGITRILSGSEVFGPCENRVCGDCVVYGAVSYPEMGRVFNLDFGDKLTLTFIYVKSFQTQTHMDWLVESIVDNMHAYSLVFHQGIWDYDEFARNHKNETAPETVCEEPYLSIALTMASESANATMRDLAYFGKIHNKRLIFRNNHFNKRYPAVCDKYFEALLVNSGWELWDNRHISKDVWRDQNHDGFHFDRSEICSIQDHIKERKYFEDHNRNFPGMLEAQLAQSLLNALFHEIIPELVEESHQMSTPDAVSELLY